MRAITIPGACSLLAAMLAAVPAGMAALRPRRRNI